MTNYPKRQFKLQIHGKEFTAYELSIGYLLDKELNPDNDTVYNAIKESIPTLTDEDMTLFGMDTLREIFSVIVDFTYDPKITSEDIEVILNNINMKKEDFLKLSKQTKIELKNLYVKSPEGKL